MKRFSIRQQVAWLTITPLLIMAISLESFFLFSRFSDMDEGLLERGKLIVRQLASSSEYGVFSNNQRFLQDIANGVLQQPDVRTVVILNVASEVLVRAGELASSQENIFANRVLAAGNLAGQITLEQKDSLLIYQPIIPEQITLDEISTSQFNTQQIGTVVVEMSKLNTEALKTRMIGVALTVTILLSALSFYLIYLAGRSITRPIQKLSNAIQAIGRGNLTTRVLLQTHISELDTLAQGLNEMTAELQQEHTTLQRRIEEATQALRSKKEEAERTSHDKSRFLAVASHDLRQPLHALGLYVAELQRKVSGAEQQHLVGRVEQSIEALSKLLNALLDISKLDAGAIVPQQKICAMNSILERVAADYQMLAEIKNINLIIRPCTGHVTSDPQLLERILMNLVGNAIRYTYPDGCVMVACRRRGNFLRIEVRDNGVGISQADQANIFREFFQVAQHQMDANKGLGLGLSIVDRLVKLLGYRIELRSASGKGTVFALELPFVQQVGKLTVATQIPQEIEKSSLEGRKLLIVDDDPMVLSSTAGILSSWGCIVSKAVSLAQARQFLQDGAVWDIVVSDYQLGNNETGIDVITMVRQHHNKQIPCILISGVTSPTVVKLASVGGHHLLHKPVKPAKLRSLILFLLEGGVEEATLP